MASGEEIERQQELLKIHRQTLAHYLKQKAILGDTHIPPATSNGITEARENIRQVKSILRSWGVIVEDHPNDDPMRFRPDKVSVQPSIPGATGSKQINRISALIAACLGFFLLILLLLLFANNNQMRSTIFSIQATQFSQEAENSNMQATNIALRTELGYDQLTNTTLQKAALQSPALNGASAPTVTAITQIVNTQIAVGDAVATRLATDVPISTPSVTSVAHDLSADSESFHISEIECMRDGQAIICSFLLKNKTANDINGSVASIHMYGPDGQDIPSSSGTIGSFTINVFRIFYIPSNTTVNGTMMFKNVPAQVDAITLLELELSVYNNEELKLQNISIKKS